MIFVLAIGGISYMPNAEGIMSKELGQDTDFVINAQIPETTSTVPYYKVLKEESIHESQSNVIKARESVPSEDVATKIAEEYLLENGYIPEDAYLSDVESLYLKTINTSTGKEVVEKKEPVLVEVTYKRQIGDIPVVGPGDSIAVSLGEDGEVIYFFKTWRELELAGEITVIDANTAIKDLKEGKTIQKPAGSENPIVEINDIEIGYFSEASGSEQDFYKPVWIFKGIDDHGNSITKCVNGVAK